MEEWLENPSLLRADDNAEYAEVIEITGKSYRLRNRTQSGESKNQKAKNAETKKNLAKSA